MIKESQADIVILLETDLPSEELAKSFKIEDFNTILPSDYNKKVRLIMLVRKKVKYSVIKLNSKAPFISIELERPNEKNVIITAIYREWVKVEESKKQLQDLNEHLEYTRNKDVCVLGDFNLNLKRFEDNNWEHHGMAMELTNICEENGLQIKSPGETFVYKKGEEVRSSELDYFLLSNHLRNAKIGCSSSSCSDHKSISIEIPISNLHLPLKNKKQVKITSRAKIIDMSKFREDMKSEMTECLRRIKGLENDFQAEQITKSFQRILDHHAPMREKVLMNSDRNCLPRKIVDEIKEKNKIRNKLSKSSNLSSNEKKVLFEQQKRLRNKITNLIKQNKIDKVNEDIKKGIHPWKVVNGLLEKGKGAEKIELLENGVKLTTEKEVADCLNDFFPDKIEKLKERINPALKHDPLKKMREKYKNQNLTFTFDQVSSKFVKKIIGGMKPKKSCGLDGISSFYIKMVSEEVAPILTELINTSLSLGNFPKCFKVSKVTALWKNKGDSGDKMNYRPISGLQTFGKIIEIAVDIQMRLHCEKYGLFGSNQHGFRRSRSCATAMIATYNKLRAGKMDKKWQGVLCFDLSAAYDTLDLDILLGKAELVGFDQIALAWLKSYVSDRYQSVKIGEYLAQPKKITCGVPQGSCLSAQIFILYTGDFGLWTQSRHTVYADDTQISVADDSAEDVIETLEMEAKSVFLFCASNNLVCNPTKTAFLMIRPRKNSNEGQIFSVNLDGDFVGESEDEKVLGVLLQNDLKWSKHLKKVKKSVNLGLYQIRRLKPLLDTKTLLMVSEGIIMSHFRFCISTYGGDLLRLEETDPRKVNLGQLQIQQNKMLRTIFNHKLSDQISTEKLLEEAGMLSINQLIGQSLAMEFWKAKSFKITPIMEEFNLRKSDRYPLRNGNQFQTIKDKDSFITKGARIWEQSSVQFQQTGLTKIAKVEARKFAQSLPI